MLIGTYEHTVDPKGRVFIPSKWRDDLGERFFVSKGLGSCLIGMSQSAWEAFAGKLAALPMTNVEAQRFSRLIFGNAHDVEMDKQGRILLPQMLRSHANLDKDVAIVGVGNRVEFWDAARWTDYNETMQEEYEALLGKMAELGI